MDEKSLIKKSSEYKKDNFYFSKDDIKINSFILIPKILFTDDKYKNLTILAKMMYSLYLNRYSSTIYKDTNGPYIIFSDKDMECILNASRSAVIKNRNALKEAGLINFVRTTGNNKVYLFNFAKNSSNDIFFHKSDIENLRFVRFPIDFFEDQFDELPLQAKFIYSLYYDLMCLSQAYYYTDNQERIYFQENIDEQVKRFNINSNTLRKYREYLKACGLLFEYLPFDSSIRYYILKLSNFKNNVKEFENVLKNKTKKEKNEYLKRVEQPLLEYFIVKTHKYDVSVLKEKRKRCELTYKKVVDLLEHNNIHISLFTYKAYENESRRIPPKLYVQINNLYDELLDSIEQTYENNKNKKNSMPIQNENSNNTNTNNETNYQNISSNSLNHKNEIDTMDTQKHKKETNEHIEKYNKNNVLLNNHIPKNGSENIYSNMLNQLETYPLGELEHEFFRDAFEYLKNLNQFYKKSNDQYYSKKDLSNIIEQISIEELLSISIEIFRNIRKNNSYKFDNPEKMINFFITCLLEKCETLIQQKNFNKEYDWFFKILNNSDNKINNQNNQNSVNNFNQFSEATKNFKWWED